MSQTQTSGKMIGRHAKQGNDAPISCHFCRGKIVRQSVKVDFRWGRKLKVIENVPAEVCQQCGEKYFQAEVYKAMEKLVTSRIKPTASLTVDVVRFKKAV